MSGPLEGVGIIDLSNMLMAPYATQILGDMGAEAIKVESPEGDPIRRRGPRGTYRCWASTAPRCCAKSVIQTNASRR